MLQITSRNKTPRNAQAFCWCRAKIANIPDVYTHTHTHSYAFIAFLWFNSERRQMLRSFVFEDFFCCSSTATRHPPMRMNAFGLVFPFLLFRGLIGKRHEHTERVMQQCTENHSDFALCSFLFIYAHIFVL